MLPLTGSLYVPAKLDDVEKVMVELGTGYFIEKVREKTHPGVLQTSLRSFRLAESVASSQGPPVLPRCSPQPRVGLAAPLWWQDPKQAVEFYNRRVSYITDQIKDLQQKAVAKQKTQNGVEEVMSKRFYEMRQQQAAGKVLE